MEAFLMVVIVDRRPQQKICTECGEPIGELFLALPVLGLFLHPRCGSRIAERLQEEAEEAQVLSMQNAFGQGVRS